MMDGTLSAEENFDFRQRNWRYHWRDARRAGAIQPVDSVAISSAWCCVLENDAPLCQRANDDLRAFLDRAMGVTLAKNAHRRILLSAQDGDWDNPSCRCEVSQDEIRLCGSSPRGLLLGIIDLEDRLRLAGGPFLPLGEYCWRSLARMRSTHSGCGIDDFPNEELSAILHAGFTAIDVFVRDPRNGAKAPVDFNDLIKRAASFGLDVVLYSYMSCYVHPDSPEADERFDQVYGELFRQCQGARAIHFVGESLEFPSKDEHTIPKSVVEQGDAEGLQESVRQPAGYYPSADYPAYLTKLRDTIHRVAPGVEVIFNTYNWGWAPLEARREFLRHFPQDVTLQVTYDIFKRHRRGDCACPVMDYSIFAEEPGEYFCTEVEAASQCGLTDIRVTSNLAGTTWDFGCAPYAPVPFRWLKRLAILREYLLKYGVNSFYDSHHYGWSPNVCQDLAKAMLTENPPKDPADFLRQMAVRDYGLTASDKVVEVWRVWSRAMDHYVASNEDQYGPWRVGPAYPFVFQPVLSRTMDDKIVRFPFTRNSYGSECMVKTLYHPYENSAQSPGPLRLPGELAELEKMETEWKSGVALLENALADMGGKGEREAGWRLLLLGRFILCSIRTTLGIKRWYHANLRLQLTSRREDLLAVLAELDGLLDNEENNVREALPCVTQDSRLGWEPRMDYVCDPAHLRWKQRQLDLTRREIEEYRKMAIL